MRLAIITINYNGSESTIKLLNSLAGQTDNDFRVFIIDNASEETDFKLLSNFLRVTTCDAITFRNIENLGFSGGNNVGIKEALKNGADWMLILNNDTWTENDFIAQLKPILTSSEGIVGVPLVEGAQTAYCGKIKWLKSMFQHEQNNSQIHNYKLQINSKFYVIGGAMAIHKDVFEKIGLLDEKYFLYFEDADFCIRARCVNIPLTIAENIIIYHNPSSTTKKLGSPFLLRYHYRNALYFNWKNGPWYIKLLVWRWSWIVILKQIFKVMTHHNREWSVAILKGVFDFYKNKMGRIVKVSD